MARPERRPEELPPEEVDRLEARVDADPDDAAAREALIEHYAARGFARRGDGPSAERLRVHGGWLVEHRPGSDKAPLIALLPYRAGPLEQADRIRAWLRAAEAHPDDADVLENAGTALLYVHADRAADLLRRARDLAPERTHLTLLLAQGARLHALSTPEAGREAARATMRDILERSPLGPDGGPDGAGRDVPRELLEPLATSAFLCGEDETAEAAARGMLRRAAGEPPSWDTGNLHFHGHSILGRIALRRGDVPAALEHLGASAETAGSPQLNSFGPNMGLAKELLERGEVDAVVAFFERCKGFWKRPQLDEWIASARAGLVPEFRANLRY